MNQPVESAVSLEVDSIQERLTNYACSLSYSDIPPAVIHAAKTRVIDTLGALIGGFHDEPCRIGRSLAEDMPFTDGATVIGTRVKTTPEMAAFVNSTTSRSAEMNDVAHKRGGKNAHPSDVVTPVLAVAECYQVNGRELLTGVVLAYEVLLRFAESVINPGFDAATFGCLGTAVAAGKLMGLTRDQLAHCISLAAIPNNALNQSRTGHLSMWKAAAAGQAGRSGVFAALLARKGMEGPRLPFEGKNGWCKYVAQKPFKLAAMGGDGTPFRIQDTIIKPRPACYHLLAPILATEKVAAVLKQRPGEIRNVQVEIYANKERGAVNTTAASAELPWWDSRSGHAYWDPQSRETADHSIPYAVAATLIDGTVTQDSFDNAHLRNPQLRALLKKMRIIENEEFSKAYNGVPIQHRARVTVTTVEGERVVGESGGEHGELSHPRSDAEVEQKFRTVAQRVLGAGQVNAIVDRLWRLEHVENVAEIPPAFAFHPA